MADDAERFVQEAISDADYPVVVFALEWCEFCHSLRKMLKQADISFRSVDLDSADYRENNWGRRIRAALNEQTGMVTIPQIFVGGKLVGGCTEVFDAYKDGTLQQMLGANDVAYDKTAQIDPYLFLPDWLHPRR